MGLFSRKPKFNSRQFLDGFSNSHPNSLTYNDVRDALECTVEEFKNSPEFMVELTKWLYVYLSWKGEKEFTNILDRINIH